MANENKLARAFIAVEFPDEVVKESARVQELVEKVKFVGKSTELENLHLTLKFLGEIDDKKIDKVREKLRGINFRRMKLKLGRIGFFSKGEGGIVWIKIEGKEIYELQKKIDNALFGLFEKEERFMGHLTIARARYIPDKKRFLKHLKSIHIKNIGFEVGEFKLKKSELGGISPVYRDIEKFECEE